MKTKYLLSTALSTLLVAGTAFAAGGEQSRDVSGFDGIEVDNMIDVDVTVGSDFSVTVVADEEIQDYIVTQVRGDTLEIGLNRAGRRYFRNHGYRGSFFDDSDYDDYYEGELRVVVTMPAIESFKNASSGDAIIVGLDAADFSYSNSSSGDMTISGQCERAEFTTRSSGDVDGSDLICGDLEINVRSSGGYRMNVTDGIEVNINSSGDVNLWGTCNNGRFSVSSSGSLDARDLICSSANLRVNSSGDAELTVNGDVELHVSSSGDVDLYGDPQLRRMRMNGSGSLEIHRD